MVSGVGVMRRFEVTDAQREQIAPLLPPQKPHKGQPAKDRRHTAGRFLPRGGGLASAHQRRLPGPSGRGSRFRRRLDIRIKVEVAGHSHVVDSGGVDFPRTVAIDGTRVLFADGDACDFAAPAADQAQRWLS